MAVRVGRPRVPRVSPRGRIRELLQEALIFLGGGIIVVEGVHGTVRRAPPRARRDLHPNWKMLAHVGRKAWVPNCVSLFLNAVSHSVTRAGRDEIGEQMADRSRDTHARGGEAPRRRDSSRDFDRRRDDGGRSSSRWDWKRDRRPGRDDRRGGGSRRARSRDRAADDRPTKRFRNDPTRGPQPGGRDAPHPRAPGMKPTTRRSKDRLHRRGGGFFQARRRRRRRRGAPKKQGTFVSSKSEEDDPRRLEMRQKQIDFGHNTLGTRGMSSWFPRRAAVGDGTKINIRAHRTPSRCVPSAASTGR